jgi:hypothetical protein
MVEQSQYDDTWRRILASPLSSAYVFEVHAVAADIVERADRVFTQAPRPPRGESYIRVDHGLMADLMALTNAAARLKALLTDRPRNKTESVTQFELRRRRVAWLREEILSGLKIEILLETGVRHSLEHFDEFLDRTALAAVDERLPMPALIPLDMAVGRRSTLSQFATRGARLHVKYLRVFIASERVFVNADREVNIEKLRVECRRIVRRLNQRVPRDDDGARGSFVHVLTPETFSR